MTDAVWLASYPKSGNTWLRLLFAAVEKGGYLPDINALSGAIASDRRSFEAALLVDSAILTDDETEALRSAALKAQARSVWPHSASRECNALQLVKVHDRYAHLPDGTALLGGRRVACGVIVVVRDPRDVAVSLAHHLGVSIDQAIFNLNSSDFCLSETSDRPALQLRQRLGSWSDHVESWLDQDDLPVCMVRYEDLCSDLFAELQRVLVFLGIEVGDHVVRAAAAAADFDNLRAVEQKHGFIEWQRNARSPGFFRQGKTGAWRNDLTPSQVRRVELAHASVMDRLGYLSFK